MTFVATFAVAAAGVVDELFELAGQRFGVSARVGRVAGRTQAAWCPFRRLDPCLYRYPISLFVTAGGVVARTPPECSASDSAALSRRLDTGDAVVIGLGSMIGAGVFAAFGLAPLAPGC